MGQADFLVEGAFIFDDSVSKLFRGMCPTAGTGKIILVRCICREKDSEVLHR